MLNRLGLQWIGYSRPRLIFVLRSIAPWFRIIPTSVNWEKVVVESLLGKFIWKMTTTLIVMNNNTPPLVQKPIYINNSRHLARKYARIFVHGHYLFREANSFPRAKLGGNCELRGTDNVQGQISEHIFASNGGYCVYCPSNLFRNPPGFSWGIFGHVTRLDQSRASEKIWWIISTDISKLQITAVTIDHKISNVLPSVKAVILWCESVSS